MTVTVEYRCPGCGCVEQISEHTHFRMHDHACPHLPADMANIPNEVERTTEDD